jgi:hypothetical protein
MAGTLVLQTLSDGTNSTSSINPIKGSAKAWANFTGASTPVINDSFNISSVTKTATGVFQVFFTTSMPNANYVWSGVMQPTTDAISCTYIPPSSFGSSSTSSFFVRTAIQSGSNSNAHDPNYCTVAVFSS